MSIKPIISYQYHTSTGSLWEGDVFLVYNYRKRDILSICFRLDLFLLLHQGKRRKKEIFGNYVTEICNTVPSLHFIRSGWQILLSLFPRAEKVTKKAHQNSILLNFTPKICPRTHLPPNSLGPGRCGVVVSWRLCCASTTTYSVLILIFS